MRLFVAVELPEPLRLEIVRRTARLAPTLPPARWVRAEGLHLTLAFLGEVAAERTAPLAAALERAVAPVERFLARLDGGGAFPPRGPARVVWLGVAPERPLGQLAEAVRAAVSECDLACDERPFRAHLTLARCRSRWGRLERERALREVDAWPALDFGVDRAGLIESRLEPTGARHTRLAVAELGTAA